MAEPLPLLPILIALAAFLAVVGVVLFSVVALFRRQPTSDAAPRTDLRINIDELNSVGPSSQLPLLECYGTPVRLSALVLAPVGRGGSIPETERLLLVVDQIVPGLLDIISEQQPVVRFWPSQLSSQGFIHSFFHQVALPGDRGKGTAWCSVAGKFSAHGQHYLAGLVCRANQANGVGQIAIQHDSQWHEVLRVKR